MVLSAVIKLEQFDIGAGQARVKQANFSVTTQDEIRVSPLSVTGSSFIGYLPAVSNPIARSPSTGWGTADPDNWKDSPTNNQSLLYRHRFAFGRDSRELFPQPGLTTLNPGDDGTRWGNLDNNSGVLMYNEVFSLSNSTSIKLFKVSNFAKLRVSSFNLTAEYEHLKLLGPVTSDVDLVVFPFIVQAVPEPFSIKNPVSTDVFIRLSNHATILASGTINLFLDDVLRTNTTISEFIGGLGGFDVTWENDQLFDYGATVQVRWEFFDTDVPPNKFVIRYPFFTVEDLAAPRITNTFPNDQAINISVNTFIQIEVTDFETSVDESSLVLYVNNVRVINGITGVLEITPSLDEKGFTIKYTPNSPFLYGDLIPVVLFIKDTSTNANERFYSFSFTTEESLAPVLIRRDPNACAINVPIGTHVEVDIIDGGHGIDKNSVIIAVDDIDRTTEVEVEPIIRREE